MNHLLLLLFLWLLVFRVLRLNWQQPDVTMVIVALVLSLTYYPIISTIYHGQVNLAVGVCLLLFWVGLRDDAGPASIAIPLTIAIVLKSYPIAFLALLIYQKEYRALLWTVGGLVVVIMVAWVVVPTIAWNDWLIKVLPGGGYGVTVDALMPPSGPWNQSINGFCSRLFLEGPYSEPLLLSPWLARIVPYLLSLGVVALSVWAAIRRRAIRATSRDIDWHMSVVLVVLYLIAPFAWEHHGVFVLPAITDRFQTSAAGLAATESIAGDAGSRGRTTDLVLALSFA